jgi:hypothetical protein
VESTLAYLNLSTTFLEGKVILLGPQPYKQIKKSENLSRTYCFIFPKTVLARRDNAQGLFGEAALV